MLRSKLYLLVLLFVLGACSQPPVTPKPEPLEFVNDPRILRGTWTGESEDGHVLVLIAEASSPTEDGYEVKGTFKLDNETPAKFSGDVRVPVTQPSETMNAQVSPVCGETFYAFSPDGLWELCGDAPQGSPPRLEVGLLDQRAQGGVYNFSLTKAEDPGVLVQGNVVHVQGEPFTYPGDFNFTKDSHAVVKLYYSISALGDGPVELIAETRLENISSFPLSYRIEGDSKTVFARPGDYFLQVEVFSGAGDEAAIGDLINEFYTPVPSPGANVEVEVTGLEACGTPDSGGFCL